MGVLYTTRSTYIKDIDERWYYHVDEIKLGGEGDEWHWQVSVDVWNDGKHIPYTVFDRREKCYLARGHLDDYLYRLEEHVQRFVLDYKTNNMAPDLVYVGEQ